MSKRYGRNQKRRHLAEIEHLNAQNDLLERRLEMMRSFRDHEISALRDELKRWRPRVRFEGEPYGPSQRIRLYHEIDRMALEYTDDPDSVIEGIGQVMMREWHLYKIGLRNKL